jgi:hypothetical protein
MPFPAGADPFRARRNTDTHMNAKHRTFLALGAVTAVAAVVFQSGTPLQAAPPPDRDVIIVNTPANPVPVTGEITVNGSTSVSGTVAASQSGTWTVGISPSNNTVKIAASETFVFDSHFSVINDGATVDIGPIDTSGLKELRLLARAINGDMHFEVLANFPPAFPITLDEFTLGGESGSVSGTRFWDAPPPSITIRLTESGPGGSNYHFVLVGN